MIMDPNDRNILLMGDTSLWRTTSASVNTPTWTAVPNLTTLIGMPNPPSIAQVSNGAIVKATHCQQIREAVK